MATPARMWTFAEVVAVVGGSRKAAYGLLERGRFPIVGVKYGGTWRFADADVRAFVERREVTNPLLLKKQRFSPGRAALLKRAS
jgi:predicted DNA-binding transcriptional regulator AlpA